MSVKTVAIAGAGDVAKYLVEELLREGRHKVVVISRARREWFVEKGVEIRITDYSLDSLTELVGDVDVLFSLLHDNSRFYTEAHLNMIQACVRSPRCKRFVPSEYGGDIERFPQHPEFYVPTHGAIREALMQRHTHDLEFTFFNLGWFMDYFVPSSRTHMKNLGVVWPLDVEHQRIRVPGTGEESVSFTAARDVASALTKLIDATQWETYTYVAGETTTWHEVIKKVERLLGIKLDVTYRSVSEIEDAKRRHANDADPKELWLAYMDMWNASGAAAVPADKVAQQRVKYFADVRFRTIEELIREAATTNAHHIV